MKQSFFKQLLCAAALASTSLLTAMAPTEYVRVIPVAFNNQTNQWNMLLSRGSYWNALSLQKKQGIAAIDTAKLALKVNTGKADNAVYQSSKNNVFWQNAVSYFDNISQDTLFIVPVKYVSGPDIYTFAVKQVGNTSGNVDYLVPRTDILGTGGRL